MNSMIPRTTQLVRFAFALIFGAVLVSGCSSSGSGDSSPADSQSLVETESASTDGEATNEIDGIDSGAPADVESEPTSELATQVPSDSPDLTPDESSTESLADDSDQSTTSSTRVTFDITVPVYVSNALQVRVLWGEIDSTAAWVNDETWTLSEDFSTDTDNLLTVTFSDQNGAITLGSFEQAFRTGTNSAESFQITADQFNTDSWDNDGDGVSNYNELVAGANPDGVSSPVAAVASLDQRERSFIVY